MAVLNHSELRVGSPGVQWASHLHGIPTCPVSEINRAILVSMLQPESRSGAVLYALSPENGRVVWQKKFPHLQITGISIVPTQSKKQTSPKIIISTLSLDLLQGSARLIALDEHGNYLWEWVPEDAQQVSSPGYSNSSDSIWVTVDSEKLIHINALKGQPEQVVNLPVKASISSPLIDNKMIYVPCRGPHLLAFTISGNLKWQLTYSQNDSWLSNPPIISDNQLISSSSDGSLLAIDKNNGSIKWERNLSSYTRTINPFRLEAEKLFFGGDNGIYAFSLISKSIAWQFPTNRPITATPIIQDYILYGAGHDHTIYALQVETGSLVWQYDANVSRRIETTPLALVENASHHIVFADRSGTVTRLNWLTSKKSDTSIVVAQELQASGELEEAAMLYEQAGSWQEASKLWKVLDRPQKYVRAQHAFVRQLSNSQQLEKEELAQKWHQMSIDYADLGEQDQAISCARRAAEYSQHPIIALEIEHDGLVINEWGLITFVIENEGFGPARRLMVRIHSNQFEFENGVSCTQRLVTLAARKMHTQSIGIKPLEVGSAVPLNVTLEYDMGIESSYQQRKVYHISVEEKVGGSSLQKANLFITSQDHLSSSAINLVHSELRIKLQCHFSLDELHTLCFDFVIDYENFEQRKEAFVRDLIRYMERRNMLTDLIKYCQMARPSVKW